MRQWALTLLLFALPLFGQNTRFDFQATTTSGVGNLVPVLAIPGAQISFYTGCTALPCLIPAVTYQSISSGTACPSNAQVVWQLPTATGCVPMADSQGNFGSYFQSGNYQFTETVSGKTFGPYAFSVGGGGGGGITNTCQLNNEFWVAGCAVGSPSLCPNGGTTQAECAANAANTWSNANLANSTIHLMPGINVSTGTAFNFTGSYAPSIEGDATYGSLIRQTGTISGPVVSYGCHVAADSAYLKNFQIDADFNAPSGLYIGASNVFNVEGVTVIGATGTGTNSNFVQMGDPTCSPSGATFEGHIRHLSVQGRGTGASSWAATTCSQSGGTPSCTVSNGGTYHWNTSAAYLVGNQSGTSFQPCTTMGTITPAFTANGTWVWGETFYQQTLNTYTLSSVSFSGFSGCSGSMYLYVPDQLSPSYGVYLPFSTDMVFDMLVVAGAGQTAGVVNANTANVFNGLHIYNNHVGFKGTGGGWINGYDCDSNLIMMQVAGAVPIQERGCNAFYPSGSLAKFQGATMVDMSADTGHLSTFTQNSVVGGIAATPNDWHAWMQTNGPTDVTNNWPGGLIDTGSPTVNPAGNLRHDTSMQVVTDLHGSEIPATSSANQVSPFKKLCENLWSGTASQQNCWALQVTGSGSGVPTQEIFNIIPPANALAPVSGRFWLFNTPANATAGGNINSITLGLRGSYWDGTIPHSFGWNFISTTGSGATPNVNLQINPSSSCLGTCAINTNSFMSAAGFQLNLSTPTSGHYLRAGGGASYVDGTIQQADLPSTSPQVGTPTLGKATCVKTAGPPVVIGFCSTQPDSTGACICN